MVRVADWLFVSSVIAASGCQVDDRAVICDSACVQGLASEGGNAGVGGSSMTGGASTTGAAPGGGAKASGGSTSSGGSTRGGASATGGASVSGGASATGGAGSGGATSKGGSGAGVATGGAGKGGSATGGSSGGAVRDCSENVAVGTTPLIDDFEDQDLGLSPNEGRSGWWSHVRSDYPGPTTAPSPLVMLEGTNRYIRVSGVGIPATAGNYPWALVKTDLKGIGDEVTARSCVYDASIYRGLRFRARGGQVRVSLEMDLDVPVSNTFGAPGACTAAVEADCYDRHSVKQPLTAAWATYSILWGDLVQQGFGAWHPAFNTTRLVGLYFEVIQNPSDASIPSYQFDLDDVEFFR